VEGGGYSGLDSVTSLPPPKRDKMESFFVAESLKYLWLLFSDDVQLLPLDRWTDGQIDRQTDRHLLLLWLLFSMTRSCCGWKGEQTDRCADVQTQQTDKVRPQRSRRLLLLGLATNALTFKQCRWTDSRPWRRGRLLPLGQVTG
jgi:Glycosyl hydrolase family 47